jgi:hypothetical protein
MRPAHRVTIEARDASIYTHSEGPTFLRESRVKVVSAYSVQTLEDAAPVLGKPEGRPSIWKGRPISSDHV